MKKNKEVDEYIKSFPKDVQLILNKIRIVIKKAAPKAEEIVGYGIPTFKLSDKNLVHFGGFKKHVGFFPTPKGIVKFKKELSQYKKSKGTIQFPFDKPIPFDLISEITKYRVSEVLK